MLLVPQRPAHLLNCKLLVQRESGDHGAASTVKALAVEAVGEWVAGDAAMLMGPTNLRVIACLDEQIARLEKAAQAQRSKCGNKYLAWAWVAAANP